MVAKLIRLNDDLEAKGKAYAVGLGISFNAVVVIALSEYLAAKDQTPGKPGSLQNIADSRAVPQLAEFKLELSPPLGVDPGNSRQARREAERSAQKATKPRRY